MAHRRKQQATSWSAPKQFDEYRLLWQLGRGGMGEVYLGHDTLLDRPVAIKFISAIEPDALMREQFLTEARAAARLQHPNVVTVFRVGEIAGRPYIISEFVRGQNLDHVKLPMPWPRALEMGIGLSRGLAAAHRRGVLHRDIKPGNVILAADGEVKLLDFGLAKFIEAGVMQDLLTEGPVLKGLDMTAPTIDIKSHANSSEQPAMNLKETPGMPPGAGDSTDELADTSPRVKVQLTPIGVAGAKPGSPLPFAGNHQVVIGDRDSDDDLNRTSGIKGTPLYMAPEVLNGEPATRRSDIYSLGALLYELCVGSPPHYDPLASLEDLRNTVNNKDAPPMSGLVPNLEPRFATVVERCLRRKPNERYASGEELRDALEQLADTAKRDEIPAGNPYRGLLPFEAEHRSLFFGRKSEIGTLVDRLRTEAFILVAADSGVGKSSLCRAGVLPLVEEGALGGNRKYRPVTLVPGRLPLGALVAAVSRQLGIDEERLAEDLRKEPAQLSRILNRQLGNDGGIILFIDQLEELVTIGDTQEVALLGEALGALIARSGNVRLLATVRSDFLARLATVPELGDEIGRALYILRPLSPDKIREVIVGPAHKKGVSFESETLVTRIVSSTASTDGGLPLLQFALAELWEVKSGDVITAQALESIGGVEGALARHADHVIGRLPVDQRVSARRILMNLVTLEGTRARRIEEELVRDGAPARGALEALVRGRLLVARDTPEGAAYEVAHEALIKGWDTLRKWLEEYGESRAVKQRLETAVADWYRLGRSKDVLWGARQIAETRLLEKNDMGPKEQEFLAASRSQAERRKRVRQIALASLPVVLVGLYGSVRVLAARDLDKRIATALDDGRRTLEQGQEISREGEKLRQEAFGLFDQMKRDTAEESWAQARKLAQQADRLFSTAGNTLEVALSLDNRRKDVRGLLGDSLYARLIIAEQEHSETLLRDLTQRLPLYDEGGARVQKLNAPGKITLSSDPSGAEVTLERYVEDASGRRQLQDAKPLGTTPLPELTIPAGSYLLTLQLPAGHVTVKYPFILERDESLTIEAPIPESAAVPSGFIYIPPGRFLFGAAGEETLRRKFFNTAPSHQVTLTGYLIAAHETTYAEYIEFLRSLPPDKRTPFLPMVGTTMATGRVELKPLPGDRFQLLLQTGSAAMTAATGEPIVYPARQKNVKQDWAQLPVTGISRTECEAYAAWLQRSGRVPGARLCTEQEWERAAKGADDREYPIGNQVKPTDANFDETYGKKTDTMGPDEVGHYPASRSPFGVDDLFGNAFEMVVSSLGPDETVGRGGGFDFDSLTGRSVNRNPVDAGYRSADAGLRICASFQLGSAHPGASFPGSKVPGR